MIVIKGSNSARDQESIQETVFDIPSRQSKARHRARIRREIHPDQQSIPSVSWRPVQWSTLDASDINKKFRLTDEEVRKNYEMYGHPDGKQSFSMGVALPKNLVEGSNSRIVLAFYACIFGLGLPYCIVRLQWICIPFDLDINQHVSSFRHAGGTTLEDIQRTEFWTLLCAVLSRSLKKMLNSRVNTIVYLHNVM